MSVPVWCADLAANFWARAGTPPPFPRDLRPVIPGAVPLSVVELPGVSVAAVRRWFERIEVRVVLEEPDRPLQACLVAWLGEGFAFVDSRDEVDERRFSVAHELGHFLRDYLHPRDTVARRIGPAALDVLDGHRPATVDERLHAILRHAPIGPFTHLLRRDETGCPLTPEEREAELAADRLAFELLAPVAAVGEARDPEELVARLVEVFGLPPLPAARYARLLLPDASPVSSLSRRFLVV